MNFILKMAWRDTRASRRRLLLFSLSVVLGVAALVAVGSLRDNLARAIDDQTKSLLGADLVIDSRGAPSREARALIASLGGEQSREISFNSMLLAPGGGTRLVQVRAIERGFPFYGEFETAPAGARERLAAGPVAIAEQSLLVQFGLAPGDRVRLGGAEFTLAGALLKVPGENAVFAAFAPRIFIPYALAEGTGLLKPGSLVRHRVYVRFPPGTEVEALARKERDRFRAQRLSFDTVEDRKRELGQSLGQVNDFLALVGFAALFLGAIGVASAIQAHVRLKLPTVAVLRCLGASERTSFAIYLLQGLGLGVTGSVLGGLLGLAAPAALPPLLRDFLPFPLELQVAWPAVLRGTGAGLVVTAVFALLPLLEVRRVSPLLALRSALADAGAPRDPWRLALLAAIVALVFGFAVWQTGRLALGGALAGALLACFAVLAALARLTAWTARRLRWRALPYAWRQGLANLHRPHNRTQLLLVSLGLGTFLLLTLDLTRGTLLTQLRSVGGADRPNLMFFDVQDDQVGPLTSLLRDQGAPVRQQAAIVTMRIAAVKGRPVTPLLKEGPGRGGSWALRHEYRSTYRSALVDTERVVAGTFTGRAAPGAARVPVSLEEGVARELGVQVGDALDFDVQGVPVAAVVGSLRRVEWRRMQPNFFVVFPVGVLDDAPKFHVLAVRADTAEASARIQQAVVRGFPNVSAIDLTLIIRTVDGVFAKAAFVVGFLALFTVATGVIVLAGAVLIGRHQRVRESVLLRTLGASRRQVSRIMLAEYLVLGALGAFTGAALAVAANWALARFLFDAAWAAPSAGVILAAGALVSAATAATGLLAGRGVCDHPPLQVLRQET